MIEDFYLESADPNFPIPAKIIHSAVTQIVHGRETVKKIA